MEKSPTAADRRAIRGSSSVIGLLLALKSWVDGRSRSSGGGISDDDGEDGDALNCKVSSVCVLSVQDRPLILPASGSCYHMASPQAL